MPDQSSQLAKLIAKLDGDTVARSQVKQQILALDVDVVPPLVDVLLSQEGRKAYAAAELLGELRDARAVQPLISSLQTRNNLLGSGVVTALCRYEDIDVLPHLTEALPHATLMTQQSIILAVQAMKDARAIPEFVSLMHATDSPVLRTVLIKALIELDATTAINDIQRYTDDPDRHVSNWADVAVRRLT